MYWYVVHYMHQMQKENNGLYMDHVLLCHQSLQSNVIHIPFSDIVLTFPLDLIIYSKKKLLEINIYIILIFYQLLEGKYYLDMKIANVILYEFGKLIKCFVAICIAY